MPRCGSAAQIDSLAPQVLLSSTPDPSMNIKATNLPKSGKNNGEDAKLDWGRDASDQQGVSPGLSPHCRSACCDIVLAQALLLPDLDGTRCKTRSKGKNAQEIQQANLGGSILHCLCHSLVGQERHREAQGHPLHRHLQVSPTSSSALETTALRSFVANFKLVLQHEEKIVLSQPQRSKFSIAQHLVLFRGPNPWDCASVRSEAHGGTKFTPGLSEEKGKRTVGCGQG